MMILLWLDDLRDPFKFDWTIRYSPIDKPYNIVWVKTYDEFVSWISTNGLPDGICFDHDLADFHYNNDMIYEKTGYDAAKWLVNYCMDNDLNLPKYNIQSSNPYGKNNIHGILYNYIKYKNS